jgi:hypothetical protein
MMKYLKIAIAVVPLSLLSIAAGAAEDLPSIPPKHNGIPDDVAAMVRSDCANQWPRDYEMRQYCEEKQFKAYRQLRGDK